MATRGKIRILGTDRFGRLFIDAADQATLQVLRDAHHAGELLEVRRTVPTRGKLRRIADHQLKIAE